MDSVLADDRSQTRHRSRFWLGLSMVVALVAVAALLAACGGGTATTTSGATPTSAVEATTTSVASTTIDEVVLGREVLTTLDPPNGYRMAETMVIHLLGAGLYAFKPGTTEAVPELVESGEPNADYTVWTFKMKPGLKFSDGSPLTAEDVKATFDRVITDPMISGWFPWDVFSSVNVTDPSTAVFELKAPRVDLPSRLALCSMVIMPAAGLADAAFFDMPVFAGPYKLEGDWKGDTTTLVRNEFYAGDPPVVDRVILKEIVDPNAALTMVLGGELDMMYAVPADAFNALDNDAVVKEVVQMPQTQFLTFNTQAEGSILTDVNVRKAIALALDRTAIAQIATGGLGEPWLDCFPPGFEAGYAELFPAQPDIAAAQALLKGTAAESGAKLTIECFGSDDVGTKAMNVIQQQLAAIGIEVTATPLDDATMYEHNDTGNTEAVVGNFGGALPAEAYTIWLSGLGGIYGLFTGWPNTEIDTTISDLQAAITPEDLDALANTARAIYAEDVPWVALFASPQLVVVRAEIKDVVMLSSSNYYDIARSTK